MDEYKQIKNLRQWNRFFNSLKRGDVFEVLFDEMFEERYEGYIEVFINSTSEGLKCFEIAKRYGPEEDWEPASKVECFYITGCLSSNMRIRRI